MAEGSVVLAVSGEADDVERILALVREIKGEPPIPSLRRPCKSCAAPCVYREEG